MISFNILFYYYYYFHYLVLETGVRLYLVAFSILGILIELEITAIIRTANLCQAWEYRGFFFTFIGLFHVYTNKDDQFDNENIVLCLQLVGYFMMLCGIIYLLLGFLHFKKIRDEKMARYVQLISVLEVCFTCIFHNNNLTDIFYHYYIF